MDLQLKHRKAVVTGSTAGIGLAIAERLYVEGADVVINGRTEERVAEAIRSLRRKHGADTGGSLEGVAADLATATGAESLLRAVPEADILVNNLGVYEAKPVDEIADEDWLRLLDINVVSGARLARRYLTGMKQRDWGRIVFIASEAGVNIPPEMIHYGVSKAAQIALSRGLAETTAGTAVTVNAVLPGPTYSEGVSRFLDDVMDRDLDRAQAETDFLRRLRPTSLIRRFARAEEVADLVAFVTSPLASATNGAALRVEGGLLRGAF